MNQKIFRLVFFAGFGWILSTTFVLAGSISFRNAFTFYGDNTEFFEPFRLRETLLGEQFKSFLNVETGPKTSLWAGIFADHPSAVLNSSVNVLPILSFSYNQDDSKGVFGTLQPVNRHGLLEPMEVTTLEITRPIEYGMQWVQTGEVFKSDIFLNWQTLLTPSSRETFDYGGSARFLCLPFLELDAQIHCYHAGGVTYGGVVRNNFTGGLGLNLKSKLPLLGESSLAALGFGSNDTNRPGYPGPVNGGGLYFRGGFSPFMGWEAFGVAWFGKDYMSEEGDSNYNSYGYNGIYYLSDRHYEETGIRYSTSVDKTVNFNFEIRSHWIENSWAHSFRILVQAPFDINLDINQKKTDLKDQENE